jgi:hypothetical protein
VGAIDGDAALRGGQPGARCRQRGEHHQGRGEQCKRKHSHDAGKTSSRSAHRISPKRLPHPPCPECAIDQAGHGAHKQRARGRMVPLPHRPLGVGERSQLRDRLAREAWPRSFNVEQTRRSLAAEQTLPLRLVVRTGHPSPSPVLGRPLWAQPMDRSVAPQRFWSAHAHGAHVMSASCSTAARPKKIFAKTQAVG